MKAEETRISPLLKSKVQYQVPLFQRTYSWGKKEWSVLWEDLSEMARAGDAHEPGARTHFIGSIVISNIDAFPQSVYKFLLIDGQQRLTTLFILLAVLREAAHHKGDAALADEINNLLTNQDGKGDDYLKLIPTHDDRDAFTALVLHNAYPDPDSRISECARYFERALRREGAEPEALLRLVVNHLSVVTIRLEKDDNAHLVFEGLNAKGKPLTQADLIRNLFLMKLPADVQKDIYDRYWKPMQDALGDRMTEFIRHYLASRGKGAFIRERDVYYMLKKQADALNTRDELTVLHRNAGYYARFLAPEREPSRVLRAALEQLRAFDNTTTYPFLLRAYDDYASGRLSEAALAECIGTLENYLVRQYVAGRSGRGQNRFFPVMYSQASEAGEGDLLRGLKHTLQMRAYPRDAEFRERFRRIPLYGGNTAVIQKGRFMLMALERSYGHKEAASFENAQIEHVMPQNTAQWQDALGDGGEEAYEERLHTIGNLTLTGYNAEMSNRPYAAKRDFLRRSHFELNRYFQDVESWTFEAIDARADHLAQRALEIWPYFGQSGASDEADDRAVRIRKPKAFIFIGMEYPVSTWADMYAHMFELCYRLDSDLFTRFAAEHPTALHASADGIRRPHRLSTGWFIERYRSGHEIRRSIRRLVRYFGLSDTDWDIVLAD